MGEEPHLKRSPTLKSGNPLLQQESLDFTSRRQGGHNRGSLHFNRGHTSLLSHKRLPNLILNSLSSERSHPGVVGLRRGRGSSPACLADAVGSLVELEVGSQEGRYPVALLASENNCQELFFDYIQEHYCHCY